MPGQMSYAFAGSGHMATSLGARAAAVPAPIVKPKAAEPEAADSADAERQDAVPDSTTIDKRVYNHGEDVLVENNKDGRFYCGTVKDERDSRYLVEFGDGTRSWWSRGALRSLAAPEEERGALCLGCKRRDAAGLLLACTACGRNYHAACHAPPPAPRQALPGETWYCRHCMDQRYRASAAENRALRKADHFKRDHQHARAAAILAELGDGTDGSDDVSSIGSNMQTLMCCRCMRWYHQRWVTTLRYPLYAGDKFYVYLCRACNGGCEEYLRRVELRWMDLAHLALYNLSSYSTRTFFDLNNVIMPYITDNWAALQLPEKMWSLSYVERRERIAAALATSRARFKNGRESKKRATIWGLRLNRPPPPPSHLEPLLRVAAAGNLITPLTDQIVAKIAPRLKLLPAPKNPPQQHGDDDSSLPSSSNANSNLPSSVTYGRCDSPLLSYGAEAKLSRMIIPVDNHWMGIMTGKRFQDEYSCSDDSRCASPSFPPRNNDLILRLNNDRVASPYTFEDDASDIEPIKPVKEKQLKLYKMDYEGGGFVKKSVPFPKLSLKKLKKDGKKRREDNSLERVTRTRRSIVVEANAEAEPLAQPEAKVVIESIEAILPPTPPTSVSAPPTPPAETTVKNDTIASDSDEFLCVRSTEKAVEDEPTKADQRVNLEICKLSTTNTIEHSKIMSLYYGNPPERSLFHDHESSGDETSSRGTLDTIIPIPKDFCGRNNPFFSVNKVASRKSASNKLFKNSKNMVKPVAANPYAAIGPLMRPLKRQLSEKDIIVGPNGEVKRRRFRRPRKNSQLPMQADQADGLKRRSRTASLEDHKSFQAEVPQSCADGNLHGRRLRQRQERNYVETGRRSSGQTANSSAGGASNNDGVKSLHLSPAKNNPCEDRESACFSLLKSSISSYFGAPNRILSGEQFSVAASRISLSGKLQYLIEFEGHTS